VVDCSEGGGGLLAYPNPAKDKLRVSYDRILTNVKPDKVANFYLINRYGQIVCKKSNNLQSCDFNLKNLNPGLYIVKIEIDDILLISKVIISP